MVRRESTAHHECEGVGGRGIVVGWRRVKVGEEGSVCMCMCRSLCGHVRVCAHVRMCVCMNAHACVSVRAVRMCADSCMPVRPHVCYCSVHVHWARGRTRAGPSVRQQGHEGGPQHAGVPPPRELGSQR